MAKRSERAPIRPGHAVISGWYGQENVGDEAMLAVLLDALERRSPEMSFTVLSERPERVLAVHGRAGRLRALAHPAPYGGSRALDPAAWRATARIRASVGTASLFVLGGGSLLRDGGRSNYLRLLDELWFAERAGVRAAVVGVSAGPLRRRWGRALARRLLARVALLSVRDEASRRTLVGLGLDPRQVAFDGDLTLALGAPAAPRAAAAGPILVAPCRAMLTGLRDGPPGNPELVDVLASTLDALVASTGAAVHFVPFRCAGADEDDRALCERIRSAMSARQAAEVAPHDLDAGRVKARFAGARLVLAARLHALHFALHAGVPSLAIAYGPKVSQFFADLGLCDFALEPGAATREALLERAERLQRDGAHVLARARQRLEEQAGRVESMLERLAALAAW